MLIYHNYHDFACLTHFLRAPPTRLILTRNRHNRCPPLLKRYFYHLKRRTHYRLLLKILMSQNAFLSVISYGFCSKGYRHSWLQKKGRTALLMPRDFYIAVQPPSIFNNCPVVNDEASDAKYIKAPSSSPGLPGRPMGQSPLIAIKNCGSLMTLLVISLSK